MGSATPGKFLCHRVLPVAGSRSNRLSDSCKVSYVPETDGGVLVEESNRARNNFQRGLRRRFARRRLADCMSIRCRRSGGCHACGEDVLRGRGRCTPVVAVPVLQQWASLSVVIRRQFAWRSVPEIPCASRVSRRQAGHRIPLLSCRQVEYWRAPCRTAWPMRSSPVGDRDGPQFPDRLRTDNVVPVRTKHEYRRSIGCLLNRLAHGTDVIR